MKKPMRNTHRFTFLLLFLLAVACQNDRSPSSADPAPSIALPEVVASVEAVKSLGENEFFFKERLSSISADGDSAFWLGSEAGDLWNIKGRAMQNYNLGVDRIYKVVSLPKCKIIAFHLVESLQNFTFAVAAVQGNRRL